MNWLFGTKKKSPEVFVAEDTPEGFTNVSMRKSSYESPLPPYPSLTRPNDAGTPAFSQAAPYPPYPPAPWNRPSWNGSPAPPYPPAPSYGVPPAPSYGAPTVSHYASASRPTATNPLDSVPFVLSPSLTAARTRSRNEFDSYRAQVMSLKDKLSTTYSYDFSLERSVIRDYSRD